MFYKAMKWIFYFLGNLVERIMQMYRNFHGPVGVSLKTQHVQNGLNVQVKLHLYTVK